MVKNGDIVILSNKEAKALINKECKKRLHMRASEFVRKRKDGKLSESTAVHEIEMLLRLAYK